MIKKKDSFRIFYRKALKMSKDSRINISIRLLAWPNLVINLFWVEHTFFEHQKDSNINSWTLPLLTVEIFVLAAENDVDFWLSEALSWT